MGPTLRRAAGPGLERTAGRPRRRRRLAKFGCVAVLIGATTATAAGCSTGPSQPVAHASSGAPGSPRTGTTRAGIWQPKPGLTWQWQLTEPVDTSVDAQVYDIDGQENSAAVVAKLHALGRKVICYVDVGSYEDYRPDAGEFPASVLGKANGWPGERWLDIRQISVLKPIMAARIAQCAQKGFDGVEPDNVDGYQNDTGFPLTAAEQIAYDEMIAGLAHADGLAVALKNDVDQVPQLLGSFDFAVDEQCYQYQECDALEPFVRAGKAVFEVEYSGSPAVFCPVTTALGFSSMLKDQQLDATRTPCPG